MLINRASYCVTSRVVDPDGHQDILFRFAHNLTGAALEYNKNCFLLYLFFLKICWCVRNRKASFVAKLHHSGVSTTTEDAQASSSWGNAYKNGTLGGCSFLYLWSQVTNYNCSLRSNSSKCFWPRLAVLLLRKSWSTSLRPHTDTESNADCFLNENAPFLKKGAFSFSSVCPG